MAFEKELKWGFVGEAAYVGTRQVNQLGIREQNWSPIGGGSAGRQMFQKFGSTAATLLIVARSYVFIAYDQAFFDSDQAVFGLMAKHLIEGRAFPLFLYGQTYLLAVDAWAAVPMFLVLGPTAGKRAPGGRGRAPSRDRTPWTAR